MVILLAGVPGDSESEKAYQEQLQQWIELAKNSRASKIFALTDNPEASNLPVTPEDQLLKGDRSHFLALSNSIGGATNPLVVIAWGHGGKQGPTPVLHVRGPRLTPTDFVELADQIPVASSRWVLWFRGSGAVASKLAGPDRQVLASDSETMFSNDPIGMQLLLRILRSAPQATFAQVAENLGRATVVWYSERTLARTEEPTLWLAEHKPRLLASDETKEDNAPSLSERAHETTTNHSTESLNKEPEPENSSPKLSPSWNDIKKLTADQFPQADAMVLRQHLSCTLGKRPAIITEQEQFIQILTPDGKQYGDFDVAYSPPGEEIEFLDCEVLQPNGKLLRLDPDAISEAGEPSVGDYQMGRRKFFSLPGVTPGAVLHVRYRTQWNDFPLPHLSLELPLAQELPARQTLVEVSVPKELAFHFAFEEVSAPDPEIKQTSYSSIYSWQFANLPPQPHEALTSPHRQARLLLSTFPDWKSFSEWYGRINKLSGEVTPEIDAKAKELIKDSPTESQKVLTLYNYVASLRYVAIPLGINTVRPHAAANVLQNQFGDCKDKANLFNALLQVANIQAHLVLVPRFSQAYEGIPGLAFNHAISQVLVGKEVLWVDTTDEVCRFGMLPPGDPGRKVLVIDGHADSLTQLPSAAPDQHRLQLRGELHCGESAEALSARISGKATGYPDYELRTTSREAKEHLPSIPLLSAKFRPVAGSLAVEQQTATAVSALDQDFAWQCKGAWFGGSALVEGKCTLHSPFWLPKEWDLALNRRYTPLFLNQGYPLSLDEEFDFTLPVKPTALVLPPARTNAADPLRWRVEWARIGDDKLSARLQAQLARGELSEAETGAVQKQLRALFSALGSDASFVTR